MLPSPFPMTSKLWTWERCGHTILTLKNRLGFFDKICFLKWCVHDDGTIHDELAIDVPDPETLYWILTHYAQAEETPATGELIPYDKLPGGYAYFGAFRRMAINPLQEAFGNNPEDFERCCLCVGGEKKSYGDISFEIRALPLIPITIILWERTEEFPSRCSFLYDTSASQYLPTEDLAHLGELLTHRLLQVLQ
jgi:hypothetical protein